MEKTSISYSVTTSILFFHSLIITSCMAISHVTTDQSALFALKSSISYDPQDVISRNWSSSNVCTWFGIICSSKHQRVAALNISYMNLQGKIPPELGNLSFLVSLDMRNNSFYGVLPQEFAKLRRLRFISLSNNNLNGPFPSFFASLPNLRSLYLTNNKFSGPIPTSIANVSNLVRLALNQNFLEGKIPQEIGNLSNLAYLNLEYNQLTGNIPLPIFNLSALQEFHLTNNNLTGKLPGIICDNFPVLRKLYLPRNGFEGTIPSSLQKCKQLQMLSLAFNEFIGNVPREIGNLTSLIGLDLSGNNLEGQIPKEMSNLQKLEIFFFDYNVMSGSIPASIFNMSELQMLSFADMNLSGNLPPSLGQGLPNLQTLYLDTNSLSGSIPDSISNASKLTILELSKNNFTGPIPNSLGDLQFLELINLEDNQFMTHSSASELSILTSLTKCRHLTFLALGNNPLGGKLPTSIGNFSTSLKLFSAFNCRIQGKVPQEVGNLSNLPELTLFGNELIGSIPTTIIGLQKLERLDLFNNMITDFIPVEICNLGNVGALDLRQNQISGALPECLGNMTSLRYLHLSSNRLNSNIPPSIWKLKYILEFDASSNMLSGNLPLEIEDLKVAILIDLSMNNLSGNIPTTIGGLESLINLSLQYNKFEGPIPDSLGGVLSLEYLDISHNNLTGQIPKSLQGLAYLSYFNVSFNNLSGEIPNGGPFRNFTKQSFASNGELCGASRFEVPPCHFNSPKKPRGKRVLHIVLYTTLAFASLAIILVVLIFLKCPKRRTDGESPPQVLSRERISYDELQEATEGFNESNMLGTGGFSSVYKGRLRDGLQVAVKVFNVQLESAFRSFDTECEVLRSLRHRNLTKVISSCTNLDFRALVLEYMPNESLEKWLYSHNYFLDILQRMSIVIDVANALNYLHNGYLMPVVHCDLKPSNILLDDELVGHVSDFGISKILQSGGDIARTKTLATIGYIAPEYGLEGLVSTKSDVYSYGVVLMETFTRMKPGDDLFVGELSLRQWIKDSLPNGITRVIDSNLFGQDRGNLDGKVQCLLSIMELALKCTEEKPETRISIEDALTTMTKIKLRFITSCEISSSNKM